MRAQLRKARYKLHEQQRVDGASDGYEKDQLIHELRNDHTYSTTGYTLKMKQPTLSKPDNKQ
jgi:hypothetical protein